MPGSNWAPVQHLNGGRVEWPTGPITDLGPNSEPRWIDAWVVQGGGQGAGQFFPGACQSSRHTPFWSGWGNPPFNRWIADEPGWLSGSFNRGAAIGIALLATTNTVNRTHDYDWWFEVVALH
jgi:hypothetical protein